MGSALGCGGSAAELAGIGFVQHRAAPWPPATEATPAAPSTPTTETLQHIN